jgi:hypothetical protein
MKKLLPLMTLGVAVLMICLAVPAPSAAPASGCTKIQSGTLTDVNGNVLTTGYDKWGYNYQAHAFNGFYDNFTRPSVPATDGDRLEMKWNDAWLSNVDCDGDGKLDRYFGYPSYRGSGAWLTNHQSGSYEQDGVTYHWTYFVKIVAAPLDAVVVGGNWTSNGVVIGPVIWGDFAIIQELYNDPGTGDHGLLYKSPTSPGFGVYKP